MGRGKKVDVTVTSPTETMRLSNVIDVDEEKEENEDFDKEKAVVEAI